MMSLACTGEKDGARPGGVDTSTHETADSADTAGAPDDTGGDTDTEPEPAPEPGRYALSDGLHVPLPYIRVRQLPPSATLEVILEGAADAVALAVTTEGAFAIDGDLSPLAPDERRSLTLRYVGATDAPGWSTGGAVVSVGDVDYALTATAVVGDRGLPEVVDWALDDFGLRAVAPLPSAPFADVGGDASVLLYAPDGLTDRADRQHVTHLHGFNAVLEDIAALHALTTQHALSGRDALLVVPQGPYDAASSDFGQLDAAGGHYALLRDAVSLLYRDGWVEHPGLGDGAITAHSGGYLSASYLLLNGDLPIRAVHLFDALYAQEWVFEDYALSGAVLRSSYTDGGGTDAENEALRDALRRGGLTVGEGFEIDELAAVDASIGFADSTHMACVTDERHYARWLAASGLSRHPLAPPELLSAAATGAGRARVAWWADEGAAPEGWRVWGSEDGGSWEALAEVAGDVTSTEVPARPWLQVTAVSGGEDGAPSDAYGATGADWLVVDGFDRVLGGSWPWFTHDFAASVGAASGEGFSTASNEAVITGAVSLEDYAGVIWLLGDESEADRTFDRWEQWAIEDYLDAGGRLIVSGSEVGYGGDRGWLEETLGAAYLADDAGTTSAGGYTFGVTYEEDWPDVLTGDVILWEYAPSTPGGGAAVGRDRQVIVVGFPLETLHPDDRAPALQELTGWLK